MPIKIRNFLLTLLSTVLFFCLFTSNVSANHSWNGYHWERSSNPFSLKLGDNLTSSWDPYLMTTSNDWGISSVLDTTIVTGLTTAKRCRATQGRVEVCNSKYGNNGWLGIAQVWVNGNHIAQGITKVNDTYFVNAKYNTPFWKNLVMCQEVGHTIGLDHQDEDFNNTNLGTCMDYTSSPESNQHPNAHDYEELDAIYAHLDGVISTQSASQKLPYGLTFSKKILDFDFTNRSEWGRELKNNKHVALFERDFGKGDKVYTFTIWAQD